MSACCTCSSGWKKRYERHPLPGYTGPARKNRHLAGGPEAWIEIDRYAQAALKTIPTKLQQFLQQPENIKKIQDSIPEIIERINIRKIVADNIEGQRTEDFESMLLRVAGENLAAIEVIGGLLGMLAGLALHRPLFLLVLPVATLALIGLEKGLDACRR